MKEIWKISLFNFWVVVPENIAMLAFKTNFIPVCNSNHTIGGNLKILNINNKKYCCWEKELIIID